MPSLPKIDMPIFTMVLPASKETVKYRPFTVKEEKILLIARETKDLDQIILSIKQVINNCLLDKDIDDLSMVDLEFALLTIRGQSVDTNIKFGITDPDTQEPVQLEINLNDITLFEDPTHSNQVKVNDQYTLIMRYPSIDEAWTILKMGKEKTSAAVAEFEVLLKCLDKLVSEDEVFKFDDFSQKEVTDFVESLDNKTIKRIEAFFTTMPKLKHTIPYKNSAGADKTFVLQGIETFFT